MKYRTYGFCLLLSLLIICNLNAIEDIFISHDGNEWVSQYTEAKNLIKSKKIKQRKLGKMRKTTLLCDIFRDTKWAINYGFLNRNNNMVTRLDKDKILYMQLNTKVIYKQPNLAIHTYEGEITTKITLIDNEDIVDIAKNILKQNNLSPFVVHTTYYSTPIFAAKRAEAGLEGREETIFLRSNYHQALLHTENPHLWKQLQNNNYKIPQTGLIYTPKVTFFRASRSHGFAFYRPFYLDLAIQTVYEMYDHNCDILKEKMRTVLRTAYLTNHRTILFGNAQCNQQKYNSSILIDIFKQVLKEAEFQNLFSEIVFII